MFFFLQFHFNHTTFAACSSERKCLIHNNMKKTPFYLLLSACRIIKDVVIYDNGKTSNGSRYVAIDRNNFYLNGIKYTVVGDHLMVSGYDSKGIVKKKVKIASSVNFKDKSYKVLEIGECAFDGCESLTFVTIPNSVTSIGNRAFAWCKRLTSITIPNSVTSIGDRAFSWCFRLTSITIPQNVACIGDRAFDECFKLETISVASSNATYDSRENCNAIIESSSNTLIAGCKKTTIPSSVTSIGNGAFDCCFGLTSITIPNSVTSIEECAFYRCESLTSIVIPNSVTSIGDRAFSGCKRLTPFTIPNSVTCIGESAFAFCDGLTSITIPNSVTSIGEGAFSVCKKLKTISVASGNKTYDSRENCNAIVESSSSTLIAGCMKTIIPNSVTSIGNRVFDGCKGLTSIQIPDGVTGIGEKAFAYCHGLIFIVIPNSVTSIGEKAFYNCVRLTSIAIPNSVTSIGEKAFALCERLTSITIPNSVTSIGERAFIGCDCLTSIHCRPATPPAVNAVKNCFSLENKAFSEPFEFVTLHVPKGCSSAYKAADGWNSFAHIVEEE